VWERKKKYKNKRMVIRIVPNHQPQQVSNVWRSLTKKGKGKGKKKWEIKKRQEEL
jgi:hypothetical protein